MKLMKKVFTCTIAAVMLTSLLQGQALADTKGSISVKVTKTDIQADGVFNTGGYASLKIKEDYDAYPSDPQAALVDRNGNFLMPYKYTWLEYYYDDGIISLVGDAPSYAYYRNILDEETGRYKSQDDPVGFYTMDGKSIPLSQSVWGATPMFGGYAFIFEYEYSLAQTTENNSYIIDKDGNVVLKLEGKFNEASGSGGGENVDFASSKAKATWISEGLMPCWSYATVEDSYKSIMDSIFYMDMTGKTVFTLSPEEYSSFWPVFEGYAGVKTADSGKIGYVDTTGKLVIPCEFDSYGKFNDGLAGVSKDGKYGYINKKGETVIPFEYDNVFGAGDGLASVGLNGKYGLVDYNNKTVVPLEYDDISIACEGVAYAIKNHELYIIEIVKSTINGWVMTEDGNWLYYKNGELAKGWLQVGSTWYYMDPDTGVMQTGWLEEDGKWYYLKPTGAMAIGWLSIDGKWYYFGSSGAMVTGWFKDGGKWYFCGPTGAMVTGWFQYGKTWYFMKSDGSMASNEYCRGYWLNSSGAWTYQYKADWKKDSKGWYYQDSTGWYARSCDLTIDGKSYNFNAAGYCTNP